MILKIHLSGDQYLRLITYVSSEANHYVNKLQSGFDGKLRTAFVRVMDAKAREPEERYKALGYHDVTLEVAESYTPDENRGFGPPRKVLLSTLAGLFDAIGLYPATSSAPPAENQDQQHDDGHAS